MIENSGIYIWFIRGVILDFIVGMEGIFYLYRKGWCIVYVNIMYYIFEENEVLKGFNNEVWFLKIYRYLEYYDLKFVFIICYVWVFIWSLLILSY